MVPRLFVLSFQSRRAATVKTELRVDRTVTGDHSSTPISCMNSFMSCQTSVLAAGFLSRYDG